MLLRRSPVVALAVVAALALVNGCARPIRDPAKLEAIKAEAQLLLKAYPTDTELPEARWPRAVASLEPEFVSINSDGIHITMEPYFDGGWGYFVPRRERSLPEPAGRFEDVGQGVYWWHPY